MIEESLEVGSWGGVVDRSGEGTVSTGGVVDESGNGSVSPCVVEEGVYFLATELAPKPCLP